MSQERMMAATQRGGDRAESIVWQQMERRMFTITRKHDSEKVCDMTKLLSGCRCSTKEKPLGYEELPFLHSNGALSSFPATGCHQSESKRDNYEDIHVASSVLDQLQLRPVTYNLPSSCIQVIDF